MLGDVAMLDSTEKLRKQKMWRMKGYLVKHPVFQEAAQQSLDLATEAHSWCQLERFIQWVRQKASVAADSEQWVYKETLKAVYVGPH